ncbi:zinc-binding dehydrogenase, partial [Spirillospora sp. NPDC049652]
GTRVEPAEADARGVTVIALDQLRSFGPHHERWAREMMAKAAAGTVRPVIGQTFPLDRAADAHAAVENRTTLGKTLLIL